MKPAEGLQAFQEPGEFGKGFSELEERLRQYVAALNESFVNSCQNFTAQIGLSPSMEKRELRICVERFPEGSGEGDVASFALKIHRVLEGFKTTYDKSATIFYGESGSLVKLEESEFSVVLRALIQRGFCANEFERAPALSLLQFRIFKSSRTIRIEYRGICFEVPLPDVCLLG